MDVQFVGLDAWAEMVLDTEGVELMQSGGARVFRWREGPVSVLAFEIDGFGVVARAHDGRRKRRPRGD